ncbi:hypothetical protein NP493_181g04009 [Ridgeia piscesae]|uniref:Tetratricopeptide repeat domain 21B n=1 Tax=Ridgeia piscesae TaxID=27915 RepID=A0AAD9UF42_RIDPI|nr:hypothetical protein NP493_181g04009 [Ridgeia piscesae]
MQNVASEGLKKYGNDSLLKFFYGYSLILEERVQEGMRELDAMKDKQDVNLCSILALIVGHKKSKHIDREAIQQLDAKLKEERKQAGEKGLYFAGLFLFHIGKYDKAREYVDRMLKMSPASKQGLALKGWLEMSCGREVNLKKAVRYFDEALGMEGIKDIDALLGKAKFMELHRNFTAALELINQVVVSFPNFLPGLLEKMHIQLALQDWDLTLETAQRALALDENCLPALRFQILHMLCRDGNYENAAMQIGDLLQQMDRQEPKNAFLYDDYAKVFCRISGRNKAVLQQTYYLEERAVSLDNVNADFVTELGFELLLQGRTRDAVKCYRNAMKLDETSVAALTGIIRCQLLEGQLEDASQQLEFLSEIQHSIGMSSELSYMSGILAMKQYQPSDKVTALFDQALETHFTKMKGLPLGVEYFFHLNPDLLIQLTSDYLLFAPQQPVTRGQPPHPVLQRCIKVLETVSRAVPGLHEALFLMGKVRFLSGDIDTAQSTLQHCLDQDATYSDAHILMAQIQLHQNNFKAANQSLEVGVSYNFEVRDHPLYHLIRSRIFRKQGDVAEAAKTLQLAMTLPGIKTTGGGGRHSAGKKERNVISVNDRVSVFLELADAHRLLGEQHEAAKVMQDAINEFHGSAEEVRITVANADLALMRDDVEGALAMLRNITPEQPYFVEAREKMANIYLEHRKDKRLYTGCYRELVDKYPSTHTFLLLGDAYMSIQEPEKAIEVYEAALKKDPRDSGLASKIGQALVKTHSYGKAINYYEAALKSGGQAVLRHDLAALLLRLRQFDKAEKILKQALSQEENATELDVLIEHSRYMVLLSKVYYKQENLADSQTYLNKARELQSRVLKRAQLEQPDSVPSHKQLLASICSELARQAADKRDYERAIKNYKEAVHYSDNDGKVSLELSKLYMLTEDLDACQQQCMALLKEDKETDAATMMLADLMFQKNDYDQAMYHFQQLLDKTPDNYEVLARLVDVMRRSGKLEEAAKFLEMAENAGGQSTMNPGYNYCKGLYEWYTGNPNVALKHFNKARKDSDWGTKAMYNMIEICLNPDNDTIGGEVFEAVDMDHGESAEKADSEKLAIRTADKLLQEMKPKPGDIRARILENMLLVATKKKQDVERSLVAFTEIVTNEREHIGALYGLAAGYMVLKNTAKARNQLKRVAKNTWNIQDAEDLEKSWLLLSDVYIQSGKYDMATELLKHCLQYNKSCTKAYEYMGYIMEKEQSYKDAAMNYEMAWKYNKKNNPTIGYKLAFNYLKAKRFVDAIDTCHHVLASHPSYPKIRKDVLDKARCSLRV